MDAAELWPSPDRRERWPALLELLDPRPVRLRRPTVADVAAWLAGGVRRRPPLASVRYDGRLLRRSTDQAKHIREMRRCARGRCGPTRGWRRCRPGPRPGS